MANSLVNLAEALQNRASSHNRGAAGGAVAAELSMVV